MTGSWDGPAWADAETLELKHFRNEGSDHHPVTSAKLLYDREGIYGIFRVEDRYVRCLGTEYMDPVYQDSCVEFFVKPKQDSGYFNFEFNCGGTLLCSYIVDPERIPGGFRDYLPLPAEDGKKVRVYHSLPSFIEQEITEPVTWVLEFFIPFDLIGKYAGRITNAGSPAGQKWRANCYKCADESSHPHWVSWQPMPTLNFHLPECFGTILFEGQ